MSNLNTPGDRHARRWLPWIGWIGLAAYALFLAVHSTAVAGGADSSGYLNSARLLARGHLTAELRTPSEFGPQDKLIRFQFQPHGFAPFPGNPRLSPTYAVGLPLHLALAGKSLGWERGPLCVGVGGAVAALLLCHSIARRIGLEWRLAATSALILAAFPVFLFTSIQPLSDTLATTWCLAAVWCALRAREHRGWAVGGGLAFAMAVLVRPTNALLLPAVVALLGFDLRRLALLIVGGVPGAAWLACYNHVLYGGALRSGYERISEAFKWAYGLPTLIHFGKWLALMLPPAVLILPFVALVRKEFRTRTLLALGLWFGAFTGLYAFYEVSREVWWDLRFILPGIPALILAALVGVEAIARQCSSRGALLFRRIATVTLGLWAIAAGWYWTTKFHLLLTKTYEQSYADAAAAARAQFPANALIVAGQHSGALYYYTQFPVLRWELVNANEFAAFRALAEKAGRPMCALLFDVEQKEALEQKCPGDWQKLSTVKNTTLWRLADRAAPKTQ